MQEEQGIGDREKEVGSSKMFIDESVTVRTDLPTELMEAFQELRKYYEAGDWFQFDMLFDLVEVRAKAYYLAGRISREDLNLIFKKYGIA